MRSLFGKHRGDLPLGGAVDARVGPAGIPVIEVGLGVLEALEAQALERRALGVPDPRLDFPLPIRIADPTRQRGDAVVREHVAVERIERGVIDVGREHAFAEIVEDDDPRRGAEAAEGGLVELGPGPRARVEGEEADALAAVAEVRRKRRVRRYLPSRARGPSARRRNRLGLPRRARS